MTLLAVLLLIYQEDLMQGSSNDKKFSAGYLICPLSPWIHKDVVRC